MFFYLKKDVERYIKHRSFWVPPFLDFTVNVFYSISDFFLSNIKMKGDSKLNRSKGSFISSLFFSGWNEILQLWTLGKDVYSTLNKTEVYFYMKHHLKLLWKHPNKKHLHFFLNPFPVFLLLFFFPFSIETNLFDQHKSTKHSSQATCIIPVGKILVWIIPSVQCSHYSGDRERAEPGRAEWIFLLPRMQENSVELTLIWYTPQCTERQRKVQDVSYPIWSRMNALWAPSLIEPLLCVGTTSVCLLWKSKVTFYIQNPQRKVLLAPSVGPLAWTEKGRKSWMGL